MSNSVEFFQPQYDKLSVGAISASVYLDGEFCDFLSVEKIIFAAEPQFNTAILNLQSLSNEIHCGQRIVVKTVYDSGIGRTCLDELVIFAGFIEQIEIGIESKVVVKDYSCKLKRRNIYGQKIASGSDQSIFIESAQTFFNPAGKGNLSKEQILFAADENKAKSFTCAQAIYYLLENYIPKGELAIPTLLELEALTGNKAISDVDITGMNIIDALTRCCKQAGLSFKFVPNMNENSATEAAVFFRPGQGREIELNSQFPGERIDISKTNIAQFTRRKNPILTHRFIVQGDYKIFEATFELVKGWNPSLEANDYDRYSPTTNGNFNQVRDVYRKWVLNEAGDYSSTPYNQGAPYNFERIFGNSNYVHKKRRFLPCVSCGADGGSLGYNLEVSYTNGSHWWPYMSSFKILLDQCGIWLSVEQLDSDMWIAIRKNALKMRLTACVMSDERINHTVTDGPVNSIIEVIDKVITLPRRFKYQKVLPFSVFIGGKANEIDDSSAIVEYANNLCSSANAVTENIEIKTLTLNPYFLPGDRIVCSPDSRDVLGVLYDNRSICILEKAEIDFAKQQTILTAIKKRK